jgi:protein-disulfide isomerase
MTIPMLADGRHRFTVALAAGLALAAVLIAANQVGARPEKSAPGAAAVAPERSLLSGIPQQSAALGSAKAPVTLVEYADLQCPYCGQWARGTLPTLVERYVRTGKLRIVFNGLAFVGPESNTALRTALAAGRHGHLWDVVDGLYARQGQENSGWVTDDLIREVAGGVPGLDADKLLSERWNDGIAGEIARAAETASMHGISSTPSFQLGPTGGTLERLELASNDPAAMVPAIEEALR